MCSLPVYFKNDIDAAISTYKTIVKEFDEEEAGISSRVQLARIYMQKEDKLSANRIIDEAADIAPNDSEVNLVKAKIVLFNKNFEQAIISLRTVIKDYPEKLEAYILLATSHKAIKEDDQAKAVINQAYENNRSNIKVLLPLATYHLQNKNMGEAEKVMLEIIALEPNDLNSYVFLAGIYQQEKQYDKAVAIYDKAIALDSITQQERDYLHNRKMKLQNR